jgi:hypothetical protein
MASNSTSQLAFAPSVDSQTSQTTTVEPLSNLTVQATAAIENVVQNLLKDSLCGSTGKRYSFFPLFLPSAHLLIFIRKNTDDDKENEDSQRMESYIAHGRTFGRNGDIFNSVNDVVQHGVKLDITDSDDEQEGEVTEQ